MNIDEQILRNIIRDAINQNKLFELVFTENGRRLWQSWPEERFRKIVLDILNKSGGLKNE